jgi:6-phosphofructokinase 1
MLNLQGKRILFFTGGGVAPALNASLWGAIASAREMEMKIYGGLYGWACLLPKGKIVDLTGLDLDPIQKSGGTFLRSSRTNPFKTKGGPDLVKEKIKKLGINFVVVIGGDDTLGAARNFFEKYQLKIFGIPKTIDNDLSDTYFTPGFPTGARAISEYTARIKRDAAYCAERIFIIESMGGKAGWITAASAYGGADIILPPEREIKLDKVIELTKKRYKENQNFAVIVISQNAEFDKPLKKVEVGTDQYGVRRRILVSYGLKQELDKVLDVETMVTVPGHHLSAGNPIEIDRELATLLGEKIIELIKQEKFGFMSCIKRPDPLSNTLVVDAIPLARAVGEGRYRSLSDNFFDFKDLKVKPKFYDYMEPILGKYVPTDKDYFDLVSKMNKSKPIKR